MKLSSPCSLPYKKHNYCFYLVSPIGSNEPVLGKKVGKEEAAIGGLRTLPSSIPESSLRGCGKGTGKSLSQAATTQHHCEQAGSNVLLVFVFFLQRRHRHLLLRSVLWGCSALSGTQRSCQSEETGGSGRGGGKEACNLSRGHLGRKLMKCLNLTT